MGSQEERFAHVSQVPFKPVVPKDKTNLATPKKGQPGLTVLWPALEIHLVSLEQLKVNTKLMEGGKGVR